MRDKEIQASLLQLSTRYKVDVAGDTPCRALLKIGRLVEATATQAELDKTLLNAMADALGEGLPIKSVPPDTVSQDEESNHKQAKVAELDQLCHALPEIRRLIATGKKVQAVKLYKDTTGATLGEAIQAIEQLSKGLH